MVSLPEDRPTVALIAGPTASGKSALALSLAQKSNGVIINADASQVYRDLQILSARPSSEEAALAPHRLFGHMDGQIACSAAQWAHEARGEILSAHNKGQLPILAGGTGLYLRTLIDGIAPVPPIDPEVRHFVRQLNVADAFQALQQEDPDTAALLPPTDTTRIARALEVIRSTGRSIRLWREEKSGGIGHLVRLLPVILVPDRAFLYHRCDSRFDLMTEQGAVEEVSQLLNRKLDPDLPVMRAIGVPSLASYLHGERSYDEAVRHAKQATRHYAKRQLTWFRNQPPPHWLRFSSIDDAEEYLKPHVPR